MRRREVLAGALATLAAPVSAQTTSEQSATPPQTSITTATDGGTAGQVKRSYAFALLGEPALPADFRHFPYVNPDAPKGGEVVLSGLGSFDSFNPYILRGTPASGVTRLFDTLLVESADEPSVAYGHLAQTIELAADRMWVAFELRAEAHFHDGAPITADDVAWTFQALREKGRPLYRQYYADVTEVTVENPRRIVFRFKTNQNRELPLIIGQLAVLPKHWWEGRDFTVPLEVPPLGSGPYQIGRFDLGRTTVLKRVADYWAKDLPTARGLANFDAIRTEYYRDATVVMQAFKSGQIDFRQENISKNWATSYDFPAVDKGLVKKEVFRHRLPTGMQGFAMNTRRPVFADRRVREAMSQVFDFEWTNQNLFFGAYTRTQSYFSNSDLASSGLPEGEELKLLEPFRKTLPPEVFEKPFKLPVTDGSGNNREGLLRALALLKEAGWEVKDRRMVNASGTHMAFEILSEDPTMERVTTPYVQWLARLGINARERTVDPAQYQRLTDTFDYDMTMTVLPQSDFPGNEQRDDWSCAAAKADGSNNVMGICDPAVEALLEQVISAPDRARLVTATRALDRVLLWGWYVVPNWHLQSWWVAYWNIFGHPPTPVRSGYVFDAWWIDKQLAAATNAARQNGD